MRVANAPKHSPPAEYLSRPSPQPTARAQARGPSPREREPTWESNKEDWDQFRQRHYQWNTGASSETKEAPEGYGQTPPATPTQIATDVALSILGGGPGIGAGKFPTKPTPRPASVPPARPAPARPARPHSAPPATQRPRAEVETRPQGLAGAAKRPGSPEGQPATKRPAHVIGSVAHPAEAARPSTSTQSTTESVASVAAGEAPAAVQPAIPSYTASNLPEGMQRLMTPSTWTSPAQRFVDADAEFRADYQFAFDRLSEDEKFAIRDWTHVDDSEQPYIDVVDGKSAPYTRSYYGANYDLNEYLRSGGFYDRQWEDLSKSLHSGLEKLPVPSGNTSLLRVADVPPHYGQNINIGDRVTNGRLFMSSSSHNEYARTTFEQGYAADGQNTELAIYELEARSAVPTLPGISTQAAHEAEWVSKPNTVFEVKGKMQFLLSTQSGTRQVTAMRLKELDLTDTVSAKNIHTEQEVRIGPAEQRPPSSIGESSEPEWYGSPTSSASPEAADSTHPTARPESTEAAQPSTSGQPSAGQPAEQSAMPTTQHPEGIEELERLNQWSSRGERYINEDQNYLLAYYKAFRALNGGERYALRDWTHVEGNASRYHDVVDGRPVLDVTEYEGTNVDLNAYLDDDEYDAQMEVASTNLRSALNQLPKPPEPVNLLRVSDVDKDYAGRLAPGDYVTNSERFMSVSSRNTYARTAFKEGHAANHESEALALYEFRSRSAVPTVPGITTLADSEAEWLFSPNTYFQVREVVNFPMTTETAVGQPTTVIRMDEVQLTAGMRVKNIHTGLETDTQPRSRHPSDPQ